MQYDRVWQYGRVKRCHAMAIIGEQTVADHSWGVAVTVYKIAEECLTLDLVAKALLHDVAEGVLGDVPAPAKWKWKDLDKLLEKLEAVVEDELEIGDIPLSKKDLQILKWADGFELYRFCLHQRDLGNQHLRRMCGTLYTALSTTAPTASAVKLLREVSNGSE